MPLWKFAFADVFPSGDALSLWACTLAIAFNDAIHANAKVDAATTDWERFYEWRVATGHFSEACLHLDRSKDVGAVVDFLNSEPTVKQLHDELLTKYERLRRVINRIRNEAAFHYAYRSGQRSVARALRDLSSETGTMGARGSTKVRDLRLFFADDVVAAMVYAASGGTETAYAEVAAELGEAVALFGNFANHALDAFFSRRGAVLTQR